MIVIKISDRAFDDLDEIESYSIKQFGKKVANKYLDDIESGFESPSRELWTAPRGRRFFSVS